MFLWFFADSHRVDENHSIRVADFGLTKDIYTTEYYRGDKQDTLPVKWMALESIEDFYFDEKTDVVSVLLYIHHYIDCIVLYSTFTVSSRNIKAMKQGTDHLWHTVGIEFLLLSCTVNFQIQDKFQFYIQRPDLCRSLLISCMNRSLCIHCWVNITHLNYLWQHMSVNAVIIRGRHNGLGPGRKQKLVLHDYR